MPPCQSTPLIVCYLLSLLAVVGGVAEICRGTHCFGSETGDPRPCSGPHCPVARSHRPSRQHSPTSQLRSPQVAAYHQPTYHHTPSLSSESNPHEAQRERFTDVDPDGARAVGSERFGTCRGADCHNPHKHLQNGNDTKECKGIECKLPLRIRLKPRPRACAGDGCLSGSDDDDTAATSHPTLVHMPDRAAQFLGDLPDFGNPVSDQGSAPLGVQLTCDIKPGD